MHSGAQGRHIGVELRADGEGTRLQMQQRAVDLDALRSVANYLLWKQHMSVWFRSALVGV